MKPDDASVNRTLALFAGLMFYWGFLESLNSAAAPFLAQEFGLDDVEITSTFGWMSLGALGTYGLARWADRIGRRRVLLGTLLVLGPLCAASAFATGLKSYVVLQIGVAALKGLMAVLLPVMITEAMPTERRAQGQGIVGMVGSLGAGLAFLMAPIMAELESGWRTAWALGALGLFALPFLRRTLKESSHFEQAERVGDTTRVRLSDLLTPRYRTRTVVVVLVSAIFPFVIASTQSWFVYFPVQHLGLDPVIATASVLVGGAISLGGFPLGGYLSDRWGRRPTFAFASLGYVISTYAYFQIGKDFPGHPAFGLIPAVGIMTLFSSMGAPPMRTAVTELFPTALRATLSGLNAIAIGVGTVAAYFACSLLSDWLGGLPAAATALGFAWPVGALLFWIFLPETRGLHLETEDEALRQSLETEDEPRAR